VHSRESQAEPPAVDRYHHIVVVGAVSPGPRLSSGQAIRLGALERHVPPRARWIYNTYGIPDYALFLTLVRCVGPGRSELALSHIAFGR